ncbi:MAG: hypothetical protein EXS14_03195 [Planctomycetes bacterium]|nr:hypothetical protein [Planctomycetota bacterium]
MNTIAWKELRSFLNSPIAYIFLIAFTGWLAGSYFVWGKVGQGVTFFSVGNTSLDVYFSLVPQAFVLLIPALAMRLWPDEIKSGTVELLMTYPVRSWEVVCGKFLAGIWLIALGLLFTLPVPWTVGAYGDLDWGPVWGAYIASLFLGGAFLSIGLFMGALCSEQVTAFIVTAAICLLFVLMGDTLINLFIPKGLHALSNALSFSSRFNYLGRGVVDVADTFYFGSVTAVFLMLNVTVLETRKGA